MIRKLVLVVLFGLAVGLTADAAVVRVKVTTANIRAKPDVMAPVVTRAVQGTLFEVRAKIETWYEIDCRDGSGNPVIGYISADVVDEIGGGEAPSPAPATRAGVPPGPARSEGMSFAFNLSGGLGMVNGGDYNLMARGLTAYYAGLNDYYADAQDFTDTFTTDLPEMKSMLNVQGEFLVRINPRFGLGLGVGVMSKKNSGVLVEHFNDENYRMSYSTYYYLENATWDYTTNVEDSFRIIPLTISAYAFFPVADKGEAYAFGGLGYYLGKLTIKETYVEDYDDIDDYYNNSGVQFDTRKNQGQYIHNSTTNMTCNVLGFHVGAGFGYAIAPGVQVFAEALYRIANFKDWRGSYAEDWTDEYYYGFQSTGYQNYSDEGSDSYSGALYRYDYHSATLNEDYVRLDLYESDPAPTSTRTNFAPASIDLSGIALRIGVRVSFGQR